MKDTAMINPERWQETEVFPEAETDASSGEVRAEKIERLRAEIASGSYSVPAEALADKMMERMLEKDAPETPESEDRASIRSRSV